MIFKNCVQQYIKIYKTIIRTVYNNKLRYIQQLQLNKICQKFLASLSLSLSLANEIKCPPQFKHNLSLSWSLTTSSLKPAWTVQPSSCQAAAHSYHTLSGKLIVVGAFNRPVKWQTTWSNYSESPGNYALDDTQRPTPKTKTTRNAENVLRHSCCRREGNNT